MSDFLLDFRPAGLRKAKELAERFRFLPHITAHTLERTEFALTISCPEDPELWAPYISPEDDRLIAVAGRVVVGSEELEQAAKMPGSGGPICKALAQLYDQSGLAALEQLSGNFAIFIWDQAARTFHLVTDCTGVFPAFEFNGNAVLFGSHPDVLASAAEQQNELDEVSLAEFALTSAVSPPFTYYRRIQAVGRAMALTIRLPKEAPAQVTRRCYLPLEFRSDSFDREDDVAEELAVAFGRAVARRSGSMFGRCAVALSGGLDSRAVLASLHWQASAFAFTCYDQMNLEARTAERIARDTGVPFFAWKRSFEYYGDNAELGTRVSGGMGSLANNHFLGVLPWLREQGARTLLTGCYCDYLFKGLPLNRRAHPLTGRETLAPYQREFYFSHFWPDTDLAEQIRARIDTRFPAELVNDQSDAAVFELEQRRTFPLCYEPDNAQRLVPQRLTGWFVPVSDPALMRIYCRIPYRWKLNRSIFRKAVARICGRKLSAIPDANTGATVTASPLAEAASLALLRLRSRFQRLKSSLATNGSWPNWNYYVGHSRQIASLWERPNPVTDGLFRRVLGRSDLSSDVREYRGRDLWLLVQMLSLKLWAEQRPQ